MNVSLTHLVTHTVVLYHNLLSVLDIIFVFKRSTCFQAKAFPCSAPCTSDVSDLSRIPVNDVGGCTDDAGEDPVVDGDEAPDSRSLDMVEEREGRKAVEE